MFAGAFGRLTAAARGARTATPRAFCVSLPQRRDERIRALLLAGLEPTRLLVEASEEGCDGGSVSIQVLSPKFANLPRVKQHMMVTALVKDDLTHYHAVHISTASE